MKCKTTTGKQQHGFTVMQMVITIAIIAGVSTFGVLGIRTARAKYRLYSSARLFASYIEKARADSVRRHAADASQASVETGVAGSTSYSVRMDFGSGTLETRTFQLDSGIEFSTDPLKVTFDWRGRLTVPCPGTKSCGFQVFSQFLEDAVPVDVSGSGDITVDAQHFPDGLIPEVEIAEVNNDDVDPEPVGTPVLEGTPGGDVIDPVDTATPTPTPTPSPTATPHGNGNGSDNGNNGNGNGNATPTPTPTSTPSPSPTASVSPSPSPIAQCSASISPGTLTLSQSDSTKETGTATYSISGGSGTRVISAAQEGNGNSLVIALSQSRIDGSGSSVISITTKNGAGNRGTFSVKVSTNPACGSTQTLTVIVNN